MSKTSPARIWDPMYNRIHDQYNHSDLNAIMIRVNRLASMDENSHRFNHELLEQAEQEHLDRIDPKRILARSLTQAADEYEEAMRAMKIMEDF